MEPEPKGVERSRSKTEGRKDDGRFLLVGDLQQINYPILWGILWGGHLARPCIWAGETPTLQEVVEYFFIWKSLVKSCSCEDDN